MDEFKTTPAHVVFLPFPAQGHIKPMFTLAKLLNHAAGFQITFVNTHHNHVLLQRSLDTSAFTTSFPGFYFSSLPDVAPHDGQQSNVANVAQLLFSIRDSKSDFRRLMVDLLPTCIIADGIMSFGIDVAEEIGIPVITFRTYSAVCSWVYFNLDKLKREGVIPIPANVDMDEAITTNIPGLDGILRSRDLPAICRPGLANQLLKFFMDETESMKRAFGLILNTFDELERPMVSNLATIFPKIYSVGPLHGLLNNVLKQQSSSISTGGLWEEDKACMTWLDSQPSRSVIYVSFGSLAMFTEAQFVEFWHGLVNAGNPFLWVIRPDSVDGLMDSRQVILGLKESVDRCFIVDWAPQLEVLAHESVGGFLTHSGWNSTLESLMAGVPMICWAQLADQMVNSRAVSKIWKVGFDMKDTCDRSTVEKMVRDLMGEKRDEIMKSTAEIARMARESIKEGGSSYCNLVKLIGDIRAMC
ncbi:7-deoxyloganetic acid glucosyl transferase [Linum perenne]